MMSKLSFRRKTVTDGGRHNKHDYIRPFVNIEKWNRGVVERRSFRQFLKTQENNRGSGRHRNITAACSLKNYLKCTR